MDAPIKLVDTMLADAKWNYNTYSEPIDAVLIAGDLVVHGLTSGQSGNYPNWPKMKETMAKIMESVEKEFPGVPIIPTIGNNDLLRHYWAP